MTYIAHHGILGQKWGIRRFQNKDGTLTAAGRKRYQVMTNPETGEQIRSTQFTPEQLARAKEHGYTVEDVEERDERGIEEARAHRKRMAAIGAAVVGVAIAALLIKGTKAVKNNTAKVEPSAFDKAKAAMARRKLEKLKVQKELDAISAKHKPAQDAAQKAMDAAWDKYIRDGRPDFSTTLKKLGWTDPLKAVTNANANKPEILSFELKDLESNASGLAQAASYTSELIKKLDGK